MADDPNIAEEPTAAAKIRAAILPIVPICDPRVYTGDAQEYTVYDVYERGIFFGDNEPQNVEYSCSVHWFLPLHTPNKAKKKQIRDAIAQIGTFPSIEDASDLDGQHFVFEFYMVGGV